MLNLLALVVLAIAASVDARPVVHESRSSNPAWTRSSTSLNRNAAFPLRFALKRQNMHRLHDELMKISDPESPHYSQHWTPDQVATHFSPSQRAKEDVQSWLIKSGFGADRIAMARGGQWIKVNTTLGEAEKLLDTKYHAWTSNDETHVACELYTVPDYVSDHLDIVMPTVHFDWRPRHEKYEVVKSGTPTLVKRDVSVPSTIPVPLEKRPLGAPGAPSLPKALPGGFQTSAFKTLATTSCDQTITPDCLRALYNFTSYQPVSNNNSLAIVEFTPQTLIFKDLDVYFQAFAPASVGQRPAVVAIDGGVLNQNTPTFDLAGESNLDFQVAMGLIGTKPQVTLYQTGDTIRGAGFDNFLDALDASYCSNPLDPNVDAIYPDTQAGGYNARDCGTVKPASIISTSYGMNEADATHAYLIRQCNEFGLLGMMGTTFLYSSGDNGVAGNGGACLNANGAQTTNGKIFNPTYPASCPFITSVGATQVPAGKTVSQPESATYEVIFSGGGFSNVFATPSYQTSAIANYYAKSAPSYTAAQYNNSRLVRGYPDLSANGARYSIAVNGSFGLVFGTSASAPAVAAILTLVNDARLAAGKKTVGFINPAIYSTAFASTFNDITNGTNPGCGTNGFSAVPGWDPVTGLGTPNFGKQLPLWLALP